MDDPVHVIDDMNECGACRRWPLKEGERKKRDSMGREHHPACVFVKGQEEGEEK